MASETHVRGLSELQKQLDTLAPRIEKNIMRSALRAGAKVIQTEAKTKVPVRTGALRNSIKIGTRARGGTVTASVRTRHFTAKWMEFGTRAHAIVSKQGSLSFGGIFAKSVQHPGSRPRPFMRVALDSKAQAAVVAVGEYVKGRLTKHGLDVAHVMVEGDE